jgi:hypothetical protein
MDRGKVVTYLAVSISECGVGWISPRPQISVQTNDALINAGDTKAVRFIFDGEGVCWKCRTCVGFEYEIANDDGKDWLCWPRSATKDQLTLALLDALGATDAKHPITKPGFIPIYPASNEILTPGGNGDLLATVFEVMVMERFPSLLRAFSLGPTQMWLGQIDMSLDYVASVGSPISPAGNKTGVFPSTWEDIFDMYMADSLQKVWSFIDYGDQQSGLWPGDQQNIGNDEIAEQWAMKYQTGSGNGGMNDPHIAHYINTFFKPNLKKVNDLYNEVVVTG